MSNEWCVPIHCKRRAGFPTRPVPLSMQRAIGVRLEEWSGRGYYGVRRHVKQAARELDDADAVLITAGAGIGVDSGLPDFRGKEGFWKAYPPIARLGKSFVEMANPEWFFSNPQLAWAFYGHRLNLYRKTIPHRGFRQLLEIARRKAGRLFRLHLQCRWTLSEGRL